MGEGAAAGLITASKGAGLGEGLDMVLSPGVLGSAFFSTIKLRIQQNKKY